MKWYADRLVSRRPLRWDRLGSVAADNHPRAVDAFVRAGVFKIDELPNVRVAHATDPRLVSESKISARNPS